MSDPRDFLALCRLAAPGVALVFLGLAGVLSQQRGLRRTLSFVVLMSGATLIDDAATRFHRLEPGVSRSLTLVSIALVPVLFVIVRQVAGNAHSDSQNGETEPGGDR